MPARLFIDSSFAVILVFVRAVLIVAFTILFILFVVIFFFAAGWVFVRVANLEPSPSHRRFSRIRLHGLDRLGLGRRAGLQQSSQWAALLPLGHCIELYAQELRGHYRGLGVAVVIIGDRSTCKLGATPVMRRAWTVLESEAAQL